MGKFGKNWSEREIEAMCHAWIEEKTKPNDVEGPLKPLRMRVYENFKTKMPNTERTERGLGDKMERFKAGLKFVIQYIATQAIINEDNSLLEKGPDTNCYEQLKVSKKRAEMNQAAFLILYPAFKSDPEFSTSHLTKETVNFNLFQEVKTAINKVDKKRQCEEALSEKFINKFKELFYDYIKEHNKLLESKLPIVKKEGADSNQRDSTVGSTFGIINLDEMVNTAFGNVNKYKRKREEEEDKQIKAIVKEVLFKDKKNLEDKIIKHIEEVISEVIDIKEQSLLYNQEKKRKEMIEQVVRETL